MGGNACGSVGANSNGNGIHTAFKTGHQEGAQDIGKLLTKYGDKTYNDYACFYVIPWKIYFGPDWPSRGSVGQSASKLLIWKGNGME